MSNAARNIVQFDDYSSIGTKHSNTNHINNKMVFERGINSKHSEFEKSGGGGNMNNYITRPEFEEHQRHLDSRFNGISKDIEIAKREIKDEIKEEKVTTRNFWIGISIPSILSAVSILLSVFL